MRAATFPAFAAHNHLPHIFWEQVFILKKDHSGEKVECHDCDRRACDGRIQDEFATISLN